MSDLGEALRDLRVAVQRMVAAEARCLSLEGAMEKALPALDAVSCGCGGCDGWACPKCAADRLRAALATCARCGHRISVQSTGGCNCGCPGFVATREMADGT